MPETLYPACVLIICFACNCNVHAAHHTTLTVQWLFSVHPPPSNLAHPKIMHLSVTRELNLAVAVVLDFFPTGSVLSVVLSNHVLIYHRVC